MHKDRAVILSGAEARVSAQGDIVLNQPTLTAAFKAICNALSAHEAAMSPAVEPIDVRQAADAGPDQHRQCRYVFIEGMASCSPPKKTSSRPSSITLWSSTRRNWRLLASLSTRVTKRPRPAFFSRRFLSRADQDQCAAATRRTHL